MSSNPPFRYISSSYSINMLTSSSLNDSITSRNPTYSSITPFVPLFYYEVDLSKPNNLFLFLLSSSLFSFFLSYACRPIKLKISLMRILFTFLSSGEEELNEGSMLTSKSHGRSHLSNRMSKPQSSKQTLRVFYAQLYELARWCSTEMIVLMIVSFTLVQASSKLIPISVHLALRENKSHFDAVSSSSPFSGSSSQLG